MNAPLDDIHKTYLRDSYHTHAEWRQAADSKDPACARGILSWASKSDHEVKAFIIAKKGPLVVYNYEDFARVVYSRHTNWWIAPRFRHDLPTRWIQRFTTEHAELNALNTIGDGVQLMAGNDSNDTSDLWNIVKALVSNPEEEAKSFLESAFAALKLNKKYPALHSRQ